MAKKDSQKQTSSTERKLLDRKAWGLTALVVGADILILYLGTSNNPPLDKIPLMWSVGGIGIITFFGTLTIANYLSKDSMLDKGEIRKALTASLIVVYFTLVSLVTCTECGVQESTFATNIVEHFTWVIGIIIVFYFGSRTVQEYLKCKKDSEGTTTGKPKPKKPEAVKNSDSE